MWSEKTAFLSVDVEPTLLLSPLCGLARFNDRHEEDSKEDISLAVSELVVSVIDFGIIPSA